MHLLFAGVALWSCEPASKLPDGVCAKALDIFKKVLAQQRNGKDKITAMVHQLTPELIKSITGNELYTEPFLSNFKV